VRWVPQSAFTGTIARGNRRLALVIQPVDDKFVVLAIEGDKDASVEQVLAKHAHDFVGRYSSIVKAFDEAERYARAWARKRARELEQCACGDIELGQQQ
jgi:hypothetical protein